MAEWSGFFDAHKVGDSWDRTYLAEDFAKFFAPLIGNGIFAGKSNELQVFQDVPASMSVVLSSGQSWIEGYGYVNDSDLKIPIDPADGALGRIDRIVNQWSSVDRRIRTVWKKGTPAVNPVAPPLRWDADYKELNICILDVSAGLSAITQDKIRDTRADSSVCGWVTGLIDQVDTSTLFAQWESAYEKEFTEQKRAWEEFFKDIQLDLGIPVPSPDKAKHVLAVDSNGGYTLSNEYASKEYADTRTVRNLLDNSDFRNPVNQRGASSYTGEVYGIDRWLGSGSNTISIESNGVKVTASSAAGYLIQKLNFDVSKYLYGKICTVAFCESDGTITVGSGVFGAADVSSTTKQFSVQSADGTYAIDVYKYGGTQNFNIRVNLQSGVSKTFQWAALYEGTYTAETLPVYQPKGYGAELAECQRYYISYSSVDISLMGKVTSAGNTVEFVIPTPVTMHSAPSISMKSGLIGYVYHPTTGEYKTITNLSVFSGKNGKLINCLATIDGTFGVAYMMVSVRIVRAFSFNAEV